MRPVAEPVVSHLVIDVNVPASEVIVSRFAIALLCCVAILLTSGSCGDSRPRWLDSTGEAGATAVSDSNVSAGSSGPDAAAPADNLAGAGNGSAGNTTSGPPPSGPSATGGSANPSPPSEIDPDLMPGADDRAKVLAAARAAVAARVPMRLKRVYAMQRIEFTQVFDGLVIEGQGEQTGFRMVDVPDSRDIAWGWLLHFNPDPNTSMTVQLRNFSIDGNRRHPGIINELRARPTTQWGIVADGRGYNPGDPAGTLSLVIENLYVHSFDGSGMVMIGDKAIVTATDLRLRYMGGSGMDGTRGKFYGERIDSGYNAGMQINLSSLAFGWVNNSRAHHGGRAHPLAGRSVNGTPSAGGIKISLRPDGTNPPVRAQLDNVVIEDNVGVGLTSTSAGPNGLIMGGAIIFRRNGDSAINLTDGAHIEATHLIAEDGLYRYPDSERISGVTQRALDANSTDVLIFGGGRARFDTVSIRGSRGYGMNGGWGSALEARIMLFENNSPTHNHLRWVGTGASVRIGDLTLRGTGGTTPELVNGAVVGKMNVQ